MERKEDPRIVAALPAVVSARTIASSRIDTAAKEKANILHGQFQTEHQPSSNLLNEE